MQLLKYGKSPELSGGRFLWPPDCFWSIGEHIRGKAGKLVGGIRWLLDGYLKGPSLVALN